MLARLDDSLSDFEAGVTARRTRVMVVGLGYAGLPLAVACAEAGFTTLGIDTDEELCGALNDGLSHVPDVASERIAAVAAEGRFEARGAGDVVPDVDVVFICVPTPFDSGPDLGYVQAASRAIAEHLRPGMLVVLQSTSYPGTTTEVVQPLLEQHGLRAGVDFALAFAPERVDPGNTNWGLHNTPKLVGGLTDDCARRGCIILAAVLGDPALLHSVSSPAIAEMAKLLENTYRMVNIALVNELSMLSHEMDIDFEQVIAAAATKPFGFASFRPGIGPGGECIPVDPLYLTWKAHTLEFDTQLITRADQVNRQMARHVVERITEMLNRDGKALEGRRVLCLGASYKAGVPDTRNSRAVRVIELLTQGGAEVEYFDFLVPSIELMGRTQKSVVLDADADAYDLVVSLVPHRASDLEPFIERGVAIFDAAGTLAGRSGANIEHL